MESLKVYWIGYGGHALYAEALRPIINELGMSLTTIHEWDNADIRWNLNTWKNDLAQADIIICPTDVNKFSAKSQNKMTQALSMGKVVICSRLDAYKAVEEKYPGCCLFADTPEEWKQQLSRVRFDPVLRKNLSEQGVRAAQDYHIDRMGEKWSKVIAGLKSKDLGQESVDIVIPVYMGTCLKFCLESIRACTKIRYQIIVVNNGPSEDTHNYLDKQKDIKYIRKGRMSFAQAVNEGIKAGSGRYVCILNDDVIVSKNWLEELVRPCKIDGSVGAVGPLSNCDEGWLHNYALSINGIRLKPGTNTPEEIIPIIPAIYDFKSPYTETPAREWVAYYCTLIPRSVIDKVGLLNEEYINSGEDVDHCKRIKLMGYKIVQNYKSFCFHFGAVSRKAAEQLDYNKYHEEDARTQGILAKIWSKKTVILYSGPSWERWSFKNLETTGIGGSEVWQIWLSRELGKLGYRVISFADCGQEMMDGDIQWLPFTEYPSWVGQHWADYAILSRTTDPLRLPLRAGKVFIQIHDVWMLSSKEQLFLDKVDKYCALSAWHMQFASDYHGIPKDKMVMTANGIDFNRFDKLVETRNPYRLHWSSSWDRGLDNVLYMWPFIKEQVPEAELHVFYGTLNWKKSCESKNDQEGLKKITALEEAMKQPGVFDHGRVDQDTLATEMCKASLLLYGTWFSETFWITGVEAQYAGVPVIANKYAGITTTMGDSAILLGDGSAWWPYSKEGREQFLNETVSILKDRKKWQEWSDKGRKNAERYSWAKCALRWKELFETSK